jgi:hypothetical protein
VVDFDKYSGPWLYDIFESSEKGKSLGQRSTQPVALVILNLSKRDFYIFHDLLGIIPDADARFTAGYNDGFTKIEMHRTSELTSQPEFISVSP